MSTKNVVLATNSMLINPQIYTFISKRRVLQLKEIPLKWLVQFCCVPFLEVYTVVRNLVMELEREAGMSLPQEGSREEGHDNSNDSTAVGRVRKLLFRRMLVGVNDGRFFMGNFHCMDKQGNIILQDAVEFRSIRRSSPSPMEQRGLGLILIPASCRTTCHIDCSVEEQLSLLQPTVHVPPDEHLSMLSLQDR